MGYSFIPVFLGNVFAGIISGGVYQQMLDKVVMVRKLVAEKAYNYRISSRTMLILKK